ncbi:adenosine deaminase family protein [Chromobacterium alticapitis]|uniref:adenosine deaminase n=1 Tax=Chromobacterium alticapitis TaxID=2073169 RepID=A0A2S5DLG4_9NEIS|nr:adenosine deaminase [Chromobacterium alticapitis]POZ63894.1 adenosine deaminase [Chromobacterium alticapitis]
MKKRLAVIGMQMALLTLPSWAQGEAAPAARQANYQATQDYYRQLASDGGRLAELGLLMNMMPKGGDLHHHYTGALYVETYLEWVDKQAYCIYRSTLKIETKPQQAAPQPGNECLSAEQVKEDNGLYRRLLTVWSDKDFYNHSHDQPPPDKQFFDTFGYFGAAAGYSPRVGLQLLKDRAKAENLQYLETMLRGAPSGDSGKLAAELDALPANAGADAINQALGRSLASLAADAATQGMIRDYRQQLAGYAQGMDDAGFTLRFQTYVSRNNAPSATFAALYAGFVAAHDNPLVVGLNIVGPENGIVAMRDYALHMRMIHFLKQRFPDVKLALHAGELVLGMVPPEGLRDHIRLAVELAGANRIGHGIDISHEEGADRLLAEMRRRDVAVEINLTSNQFILGVEGASHPLPLYRRYGVPFVISTDDEGVSRSDIGNEYLLYASRYKPSYDELKQTVYRSIRYSFLSPADKARQLKLLDGRFAEFEARVAALRRLGK